MPGLGEEPPQGFGVGQVLLFEDALRQGVKRASKTIENITGAWIKDQKVVVDKGKIVEYRVTMRYTFVLKD